MGLAHFLVLLALVLVLVLVLISFLLVLVVVEVAVDAEAAARGALLLGFVFCNDAAVELLLQLRVVYQAIVVVVVVCIGTRAGARSRARACGMRAGNIDVSGARARGRDIHFRKRPLLGAGSDTQREGARACG